MKKLTTICLMSLITLSLLSLPVLAQRGGGGGGDRGRGRGGERGGSSGGDFRTRILERMDQNRNGVIEPNEAQGRAAEFVARMARDAGLQPGGPLPISRLTGRNDGRSGNRDNNGQRQPTTEDEYPTIPRFGDESVAGFGLSPLTLAGKIVDLEKKYDRRTIENAERTLQRYDKNKNGILEHSEWAGVSWRSDPRDSDLDKDGMLTKAEMVERFAQREQRDQRSRDQRRDRGRGGEDERSRRGGPDQGGRDRGRGGRGGGFDPTMWLAQMDRNQDGSIGPDEVDERRRGFIESRFQIDLSKPVSIEEVRRRFQAGRDGSGSDAKPAEAEEQQPKEAYLVDGSELLKGRQSYRSQGRALPSQLPDWWDERDEDANGQITLREFVDQRGDENIREFQEFDLNNDGLITTNEAAVIEED